MTERIREQRLLMYREERARGERERRVFSHSDTHTHTHERERERERRALARSCNSISQHEQEKGDKGFDPHAISYLTTTTFAYAWRMQYSLVDPIMCRSASLRWRA